MFKRSLALAAALALLGCSAAWAAPATIQLRIEGSARTIFEGPVKTDGKTITKGGNTVVCDGTLNPANTVPGPTATSALDDAAIANGFDWDASYFGDFFITRVADAPSSVWGLAVDFQMAPVGGCQQQVHPGEEVLFASDFFGGPGFAQEPLLKLDGPARATVGRAFTVRATDGGTAAPFAGAVVSGTQTGADGNASLAIGSPGLVRLKAEAPGTIRSNALTVCVSDTGTGDCGVSPEQLGNATSKPVEDSVAPRARIKGPGDGKHYSRHGPRLLFGTASDDNAVTKVKLALRRHEHGKSCRWWSATRERFAGRGCGKHVFFGIDAGTKWSYLLPRNLAPGRYVLDVKAFDRARNRDERFVRGANRVVFYVGRGYMGKASASKRNEGPRVSVMLAGRTASSAAAVRARGALVTVGKRKCRVAAATPLAALAALLHRRGLGYGIRDYGNCSWRDAAAASQLFVRRVGKDSNRGNDGWFYKVNDLAPEIGAGDPAARVRAGDRVLWLYCIFDTQARSCQRSLRVLPDPGAKAGQPLRVQVRGYDDAGRAIDVEGATVRLGASTVLSGPDGVAVLQPDAGRHAVTATKAGMVSAFPVTVIAK